MPNTKPVGVAYSDPELTSGTTITGATITGSTLSSPTLARPTLSGTVTLADAANIVLNTSTGSKIGTAASQKLGFFNATPVLQQATTGTATGFTAGSGPAVNDDSTFTGGSGTKAYRISDIVLALKNLGLLAAS